jgi:cytochrome P450
VIEYAMDHLSRAFVPLTWLVDAIPALVYLPDGFPGTSFKTTARQWKATNEAAMEIPYSFVRRQMAKGQYRPSYVSNLLEKSAFTKDGKGDLASDDEEAIKWTAVSLYAAGSDSTVSILTSFILAMVMFPEVQRKAQEEIDRAVGSDRLPGFEDRENLPYISGIVKEAWRWNPVGPMGLAHMAEEDIIYNDYLIPKGSYLLPSLWWFLHDPADYSEPDCYKPERYMEPLNEPDPSEVAFGYGRRSCSGRYFADTSVFITIAQTLAIFQISKARDAQGHEIEARLEAIPGMVNRPKEFSFSVAPRSASHAELLHRIGAKHSFQEGDSGLLDMSIAL